MISGLPNGMTMVSSFSLQEASRGRPQILQFFTVPGEEGGSRLVVNEIPYTGPMGISQMCVGVDSERNRRAPAAFQLAFRRGRESFVLADHLRAVRFEYLHASPKSQASRASGARHGMPSGMAVRHPHRDGAAGSLAGAAPADHGDRARYMSTATRRCNYGDQ